MTLRNVDHSGEYTVKTFEEHVRGTEFKKAYWSRAEELVPLLTGSDQEQVIKTAMNSLGRRGGKAFKKAAATGSGPLSLAQADRVALRYGLWTVRKKYDWGHYPRGTEELTRRLDEQITSGIWDLDVKLRRNVEALLKSGRQDIPRAQQPAGPDRGARRGDCREPPRCASGSGAACRLGEVG